MKLYSNAFAPSPRRVRMFAAEKGLTLETVNLDFANNEHHAPAFLAVNPVGEVPALVLDEGTVLTESLAICRYLEELYPQPSLFGSSALERARIAQWAARPIERALRGLASRAALSRSRSCSGLHGFIATGSR